MTSRFLASPNRWLPWVLAIIGFWLSGVALLDFLVMPTLYVSGMMTEPGFASAGYTLFWSFNRLELLCVALILTGILAYGRCADNQRCRWALGIGVGLLALALVDTYGLTPAMSALGLPLEAPGAIAAPAAMDWMHGAYWGLEVLKLAALGGLARLCYRELRQGTTQTLF